MPLDPETEQRLASLEARLGRLEALLSPTPGPAPPVPEVARATQPVPVPMAAVLAETVPIAPVVHATPPPLPPMIAPAPVAPTPLEYVPRRQAKPLKQTTFEQTVGLKWAGWVGAIVLVIAAGLGIKFAYDQGWFGSLPPALRLAMMSLAGFAMLAAGEWVYRRVNPLSAVGPFAAGIATLFLVSYAGNAYFRLYEPTTAFSLMGLVTLIAAAVAIRGNLLSIAVLAHLGGNLAPILIHGEPHVGAFLAYLLMLQIVALILVHHGHGEKWTVLRTLSFFTTAAWVAYLLLDAPLVAPGDLTVLLFCLVYAGLYHGELLLSAAGKTAVATGHALTAAVMFSALVTAGLTVATLDLFRDALPLFRGGWVLIYAGAAAIATISLRRAVADRPLLRGLAVGYRVQAVVLLIISVPVALTGPSIVLAWAALALGFAGLSTSLNLPAARRAAVIVWGLAAGYLWVWSAPDSNLHPAQSIWATVLGQPLPAYLILAVLLMIAGHAIAWLIQARHEPTPQARQLGWAITIASALLLAAASMAALPPLGASAVLVAYAWLLVGADMLHPHPPLALVSAAVLIVATVKWALVDLLAERLGNSWSPGTYRPVFNPAMAMGVAIAASQAGIYWVRRQFFAHYLSPDAEPSGQARRIFILSASIIAILAIAFSSEIDRGVERSIAAGTFGPWPAVQYKCLLWTILWTVAYCGYAAIVWKLEPEPSRRASVLPPLGWLGIVFLFFDALLWRILHDPVEVPPVANVLVLTAIVVLAGLIVSHVLRAKGRVDAFVAILVVFVVGALEIDRAFENFSPVVSAFNDARLAKQVALSVYGALFALASVAVGFRVRAGALRYFGLALFAVTLLKVFVIDLNSIGTGYRILSFLGLGLLLLGTSVLYGKLSPRLLGDESAGGIDPPLSAENP